MSFGHLHLVLNHVPVIGLPLALVFLIFGLRIRHRPTQGFALVVLVLLAAVALPVYLTGEPAEKMIERLPEFTESFVEKHEDAALVSLITTLVAGFCALATLFFYKDDKKLRLGSLIVSGVSAIAVVTLLYTANLGGLIRHSELREGASSIP